ncbi:SDR family oxidoreductase [Leucobacter viscericola]|uniref:SDR family oxidoreductase n=1 Tax=Leucobacter viscericola TaxID=2714935 RepID=A0A6G7XCV9_9MICO|nr:SDR family oxidoreductase [Leucobacter viscericola]QIK62393.1 SDR family oxidoreductase [Leucobacter viscericola]
MRIAIAGGTGAVGRHVVSAAEAAGHEALVLSRANGVDLEFGVGLDLAGVDVVIDVCGTQTTSEKRSREFFERTTTSLLRAEQAAGVRHHVALSIVGAAGSAHGYYAGKALQERLVSSGEVPWTILRATQFFDFAHQVATKVGPLVLVPAMRSQPLAAEDVARRLVELAGAAPAGNARDLAGPAERRMVELTRAWWAKTGASGRVVEFPLPGGFGRALRDGGILPGPDAQLTSQTFEEWLGQQ